MSQPGAGVDHGHVAVDRSITYTCTSFCANASVNAPLVTFTVRFYPTTVATALPVITAMVNEPIEVPMREIADIT